MKNLRNNQKAFTIIELLIASTVFSMIILGACAAIIQMSRLYYKGIIVSRTQTAGRNLAESIAREIQFQGGTITQTTYEPSPGFKTKVIGIGDTRYKLALNKRQSGEIKNAIVKYIEYGAITSGPDLNTGLDSNNYRNMLANNMQIVNLNVESVNGASAPGLYKVEVIITYGDDDLLENPTDPLSVTCKGNIAGSQWCSVVKYNTMVFQRK